MKQENDIYTCPYCRWSHSHTWIDIREEEELIKSDYIGSDFGKTYYLDTKRKFNVRICNKCNKYLKIRHYIILPLLIASLTGFIVAMVAILLEKTLSYDIIDRIGMYSLAIGFTIGFILFLFYILWWIIGPSRAHVKFDRAKKSNALEPYRIYDRTQQ